MYRCAISTFVNRRCWQTLESLSKVESSFQVRFVTTSGKNKEKRNRLCPYNPVQLVSTSVMRTAIQVSCGQLYKITSAKYAVPMHTNQHQTAWVCCVHFLRISFRFSSNWCNWIYRTFVILCIVKKLVHECTMYVLEMHVPLKWKVIKNNIFQFSIK